VVNEHPVMSAFLSSCSLATELKTRMMGRPVHLDTDAEIIIMLHVAMGRDINMI
jgi:hypothetical protein